MKDKKQITMLLPGSIPEHKYFLTHELPNFSKILSRASVLDSQYYSYESNLSHIFNLEETLPVAALEALYRGDITQEDKQLFLCCADYVHFQSDANTVFLKTIPNTSITESEYEQLKLAVKNLLAPDYSFLNEHNTHILHVRHRNLDFMTNPLWDVVGRSLQLRLPSGPDSGNLKRLMTEIQMQMSSLSLNKKRIESGQKSIDGFWFWGFGNLPSVCHTTFDMIISNEEYIGGLAQLCHIPFVHLDTIEALNFAGHTNILIVDTRLVEAHSEGDENKWHQIMDKYEHKYFEPILSMLANKECFQFNLISGRQRNYKLTPARMNFFWKKIKCISEFCDN